MRPLWRRRPDTDAQFETDDLDSRLGEARRRNKESVEILQRATRRGEAVKRHVRQEQDFRNRNGFVATILDSLQARQ